MSLKKNLISNYVGTLWTSIIGLVFLPIYLRFIGVEGYGLVGFFTMLSASLSILDVGLSALATRESAGYKCANNQRKNEILTLLNTIEAIFLIIATIVAIATFGLAPLIVRSWLSVSDDLAAGAIWSIRWMGFIIAIQFIASFYSGCLNGMQKQVSLNVINIFGSTMRSIGAVLVLWLISPQVECFFAWQVVSNFCMLLLLKKFSKNALSKEFSSGLIKVSFGSIKRVRSFLGGVGSINILGLLLTQLDKLILSKFLTLENFGYYSLAWMLGTLLYRASGPIFNAYYPKMAELVDLKNEKLILESYIQGSKVMSIVAAPASIWLAFYSNEILYLWTNDFALVNIASGALSVIAIGTMFNSLMQLPYGMQLANGVTRIALIQNLLSAVLFLPLTWYFATYYGLTEVAIPWLIVNFGYLLIGVPIMHKTLELPGIINWYIDAIFKPILISILVILINYYIIVEIIFNESYKYIALFTSLPMAIVATTIFSNIINLNKQKIWNVIR